MLRDTPGQPDVDWIQAAANLGFVPCQVPQPSPARSSNRAQVGPFARTYQVPTWGPARLRVRTETECYDRVATGIGSSRSKKEVRGNKSTKYSVPLSLHRRWKTFSGFALEPRRASPGRGSPAFWSKCWAGGIPTKGTGVLAGKVATPVFRGRCPARLPCATQTREMVPANCLQPRTRLWCRDDG